MTSDSYRLTIGADVESAKSLDEDEIAQDIEVVLNDWVGVATPSGVEVELDRID